MSTASEKAKADRKAKKRKGRKNTKKRAVRDPSQDRMGVAYWNADDLSINGLELRTIDRAIAKKQARKTKKSNSKVVPKKAKKGNSKGTTAERAKAERRRKAAADRKKYDPIKVPQRIKLSESVLAPTVELTIEGASVLNIPIQDPLWYMESCGILDRNVDGKLDSLDLILDIFTFRLVKASRSGDVITLTFEDKDVALMRQHDSPISASRADQTRAQFVQRNVRSVKSKRIIFYCPELYDAQPIAAAQKEKPDQPSKKGRGDSETDRKANNDVNLQGKEGKLSPGQIATARKVLRRAAYRKAGPKATLALIMACLVEPPDFKNPSTASADGHGSFGMLQSIVGYSNSHKGTVTMKQALDVEFNVDAFLLEPGFASKGGAIRLAKENPSWSAGQIAQRVEMSDYPDRYDEQRSKALKIIEVLGEGGSGAGGEQDGSVSKSKRKAYRFSRGKDGQREDAWTCVQRLAQEVRWRCFARGGAIWYVSEDWLIKQEPMAVISNQTPWVHQINYDLDNGKPVQTVTVTARAARWGVLPGSTIAINEEGPVLGRWVVNKVTKPLMSRDCTITLTRAVGKKMEPAPEVKTTTTSGKGGSDSDSDNEVVKDTYSASTSISKETPGYLYGGGHGPKVKDLKGTHRLDCSSSTCLALYKGGAYDGNKPAIVSGDFDKWGEPGKGKEMTVWYNAGHVFIEFHGVGKFKRFDTGGGNGPKVHTDTRPTDGFQARHWKGT